jgi:hypothetical protein
MFVIGLIVDTQCVMHRNKNKKFKKFIFYGEILQKKVAQTTAKNKVSRDKKIILLDTGGKIFASK